jgi:hypothetical protein
MKMNAGKTFTLVCGTAAVGVIVGAASLVMTRPATATTLFAKTTGKACGDCHTNPKGTGPLTEFGEKFKANGNKLPK